MTGVGPFAKYRVCLVACLLAAATAHGQTSPKHDMMKAGAEHPRQTHFVDAEVLDLDKLPRPPEPGSLGDLTDLEAVLRVQARRTSADATWAGAVIKGDVFSSSDIIGPSFTQQNLPYLAELFRKVREDTNAATERAKELYRRERPYAVSAEVSPCVDKPTGYSYPSGYAVQVFVRAGVLAELFPEKRAALFVQAHERAWARIIGGVHYPSDDVAGRLLADMVIAELLRSAQFRMAMEQARGEILALAGQ